MMAHSLKAENRGRPDLQDPRGWCDKKGRTPQVVAKLRKNDEMAAILDPASEIQLTAFGVYDNSVVPKLQVFAATLFQKQLLASIQEAEEFMKLLGTHQTHGRVFARLAYNSEQPSSSLGVNTNIYETYANTPPAVRESFMKEHLAGKRYGPAGPPRPLNLNSAEASSSASTIKGVTASASFMGGMGQASSKSHPAQSSTTTFTQSSFKRSPSEQSSQEKKSSTGARADIIKEWLSINRIADAHRRLKEKRPSKTGRPQMERSTLAQTRSSDEQGCTSSFFCFGSTEVNHRAPMVGEDVCGLCHDNKPLLQMTRCEHRICLLCAKSMTYLLDLQQLVLCPYCGDIVVSFGLA